VKYYFKLQIKLLNRQLAAFGIAPILGYSLLTAIFAFISHVLFSKVEEAPYLYVVIASGVLSSLSQKKRQDFLKMTFPAKAFRTIRIVENLSLSFPFLLILLMKNAWIAALALPFLSIFLAFFTIRTVSSVTIPTPFTRFPFEFIIGFRRTFGLFIIAYFLLIMGIYANHVNLCFFAVISSMLTCLSFYSELETRFYVWMYNLSATAFLMHKLKRGMLLSTLLSLPLSLITIFFFPDQFFIVLGIQLLGYFYLTTVILAKYAAFPKSMQLPHSLILGFGMMFPPFLLILIPYFYRQSLKRIQPFLIRYP